MTGMGITTLALMNISRNVNSFHIAAAGELVNCVFDVYLNGELCYSFGDAGNAIKKEKPSESSKGQGDRLAYNKSLHNIQVTVTKVTPVQRRAYKASLYI